MTLIATILDSTVWRASKEARLVWITLLAMQNKSRIVEASVPGLADRAKVTLEECQEALKFLLAEDPWSRSKESGGRRIVEVRGGWKLINGDYYGGLQAKERRREYQRLWQQDYRDRLKQQKTESAP